MQEVEIVIQANIRAFNTNPRISKHLNLNNYNNLLIKIINNQEKNDNEIIVEIIARFESKQFENIFIAILKVLVSKVLFVLTNLTFYEKQQIDNDVNILREWEVYKRIIKSKQLRNYVMQTIINSFLN